MIVQNISATSLAAQPERVVSNDGPRVISDSSSQIAAAQLSSQNLKNSVNVVNKALQLSNQSLEVSVDSATKQQIIKLVDTQTGQLIRQIPSKEMLAIAQSIDEYLQNGQLLSEKV